MIRTDKRLRLCTALIVCNLIFIWGNSLLPANVSQAISDAVMNFLSRFFTTGGPQGDEGSFLTRKLAHFTEFAALGALLTWRFGMLGRKKHLPLIWGALAACADETIQCFVPGRGPGVRDVAIDTAGVLAGMVLLTLGNAYLITRKRRKQPTKQQENEP